MEPTGGGHGCCGADPQSCERDGMEDDIGMGNCSASGLSATYGGLSNTPSSSDAYFQESVYEANDIRNVELDPLTPKELLLSIKIKGLEGRVRKFHIFMYYIKHLEGEVHRYREGYGYTIRL